MASAHGVALPIAQKALVVEGGRNDDLGCVGHRGSGFVSRCPQLPAAHGHQTVKGQPGYDEKANRLRQLLNFTKSHYFSLLERCCLID